MEGIPYYYLGVRSQELALIVSVNGIPLIARREGDGLVTDRPINEWLAPEGNVVSAYLTWPETKPYKPGMAAVEMEVFIADPTADSPEPATSLASMSWPSEEAPEAYPYAVDLTFDIPTPPPTRVWGEAESVDRLHAGDREEILRLVEALRQALAAKDAETTYRLQAYRFEEQARAEGKDIPRVREATLEQFGWVFRQGDLQSEPLGEEQAAFVIGDRATLVRVMRGEDLSVIELEEPASGLVLAFELCVAKIAGAWRIVR